MQELAPTCDVTGTTREQLDILDSQAVSTYIEGLAPQVIINAAALTQVDRCESIEHEAMQVNGHAAGQLAQLCAERGIRLVYPSTDYVFNGNLDRPYREDDSPSPLGVYGKSKLLGEQLIYQKLPEALIIRTSWMFGPRGSNFVRGMLERLERGEHRFRVVDNQRGRPTYSRDLARAIGWAIEAGLEGTYHIANAGALSWYGFAQEIFQLMGKSPQVTAVSAEDFGAPASRPQNSVLDTSKFEQAIGRVLRDHSEALKEHLTEEGWLGC